jgi:hypothetical protein
MKSKKCKVCLKVFEPKKFAQNVCSVFCSITHAKNLKAKKEATEWKKDKAILKEKLKTLGQYEADAKKSFQKWIRMRDSDKCCISCGKFVNDPAGGHYFSAGMYSGLMFNEMNCHLQCNSHCNKFLSGNLLEYRKGLIKRYGNKFVEDLESISDSNRNYKYTKEELIAKKLKYDILIKEKKW